MAHQLVYHRRHAARMIIILTQKFACRHQIDQQRHFMAVSLPILDVEFDPQMPRNRLQMDGRVGRSANRRVDDDGVQKRIARHDVGGFKIIMHHIHDALASVIGIFLTITVRRRDSRRSGQ